MAKYFEVDFRKGSFADQTGRRSIITTGSPEIKKGDKGSVVSLTTGKRITNSSQIIPDGAVTIVAFAKVSRSTGKLEFSSLLSSGADVQYPSINIQQQYDGTSSKPCLFMGGVNFQYFDWTPDKNWHCFIFTIPSGAQADTASSNLYIDGLVITKSSSNVTGALSAKSSFTNIGSGLVVNNGSDIAYLATYDHVFTEAERAAAYRDFLNSYPIDSPKVLDYTALKPMSLEREKESRLTALTLPNWGINSGSPIINGQTITFDDGTNDSSVTRPGYFAGIRLFEITAEISNYSGAENGVILPYDGNHPNDVNGNELTKSANGIYTYKYKTDGLSTAIYSYCFAGRIATLRIISIKEVTGLVAAYNMIPQGNVLPDISGNGRNTTTGTGLVSTKNGILFKKVSNLDTPILTGLFTGSVTFCFRFTLSQNNSYDTLLSNIEFTPIRGINIQISNTKKLSIDVYHNDISTGFITTNSVPTNVPISLVIVLDKDISTIKTYINGIEFETNVGLNYDETDNVRGFAIGNLWYSNNTFNFKEEIEDLRIYNYALTLSEIKTYNNSFVRPTLLEDFSAEGADGVEKVPSGWIKQSGSFKIGEIALARGNQLTNSTFDVADGWALEAGWTIANGKAHGVNVINTNCIYRHIVVIPGIKYKISYEVSDISSGSVILAPLYSNNPDTPRTTAGKYSYEFVPALDGFQIRFHSTDGFTGFIDNVIMEYLPALPTLKSGTKYLECVTAGTIAIPSKQAYGTWEWDWYSKAGSNTFLGFISNKPNSTISAGYEILAFSNSITYFRLNAGNIFTTSDSLYSEKDIWYRFKITRTTSGVFTVLIKGGSFLPTEGYDGWTLLSTVGGTGTNPTTDNSQTTSEYFVFDLDAGDRIANIKCYDGIIQQ